MIKIPVHHMVEVSIEMLIKNADQTQLNELILLAEKKLEQINPYPVFPSDMLIAEGNTKTCDECGSSVSKAICINPECNKHF